MITAILNRPTDARDSLLAEDLIRVLTQRRRDLSLTRERVAKYMGHETPAAVMAWETGHRYPRIDALIAWCRVLRWDLTDAIRHATDRRSAITRRGRR